MSAWTGIVLHIYTRKKLAAQITTTISAIMCITATLVFMQSQLRLMWGPLLAMLGGLLAIVAVAAANIRIEIVKETPETTVQNASDN